MKQVSPILQNQVQVPSLRASLLLTHRLTQGKSPKEARFPFESSQAYTTSTSLSVQALLPWVTQEKPDKYEISCKHFTDLLRTQLRRFCVPCQNTSNLPFLLTRPR